MIPAEIVQRVHRIAYGDRVGSAFVLDVDKRQYLITAKHVVESFGPSGSVDVFLQGAWKSIAAQLVGHASGDVDISVLSMAETLCPPGLACTATSEGLIYGQDLYFLGFPYGVMSTVQLSVGSPLPLVKKAILSAFAGDMYLLDGHNNPGFSGGPVVFAAGGRGSPSTIGAVVGGFHFVDEPIMADGEKTSLTYEANTGIVYSYGIELAMRLIAANPIGLPLP